MVSMCPATSLGMSFAGLTEPHAVASSPPRKRASRKAPRPRLHAVLASVALLLWLVPAIAPAQQRTPGPGISSPSLPDAPIPNSYPQNPSRQASPAEGSASVAGTVLDVSGGSVSGADVSLMHGDGTQLHTMVSEPNGEFSFTKVPAGSYLVTVNAKGFAPFTSPEFVIAVQQAYEVPDVSLSITTANMEVTVRPTELIAAEQLRRRRSSVSAGLLPKLLHQLRL